MKRVALIPSSYHPAVGGVEVLTRQLARRLRDGGCDVEVWTSAYGAEPLARDDEVDGIRVLRFRFSLPRTDPLALPGLARTGIADFQALRAASRRFQPTQLHVHCFSANGVYATALSRATGVPLIVSLHGETRMDAHDIYDKSTVLRTGLRWGLRNAGAVTACSQFVLDDARARFGLAPAKGEVIRNGIDLEEVDAELPQDWQAPTDRFVLAAGRLVHKKGFDLLIRAYERVHEELDADLVIAGQGAELDALCTLRSELGIAHRVHLPGRADRRTLRALMDRALAVVMPSRIEPFGIIALEAWRSGKPVVVTSRGGASEFVEDGHTGLVVDPLDGDSLANALRRVVTDPALARRLGSAGLRAVQAYSWDAVLSDYEGLYARVEPLRRKPH